MTTNITSPTTTPPTTSASGASPSSQSVLGSNFNTFLTLLTAQLRNQDPLSPLDTNQFTAQLVQFSQVEQAINTNTTLSSLLSLQQADQSVTALPLVGKSVAYTDNQGGLVNGAAQWQYNLASQAKSATITITDATGNIVLQQPADTGAGQHSFNWNGIGSNGSQLPDGAYTFNVSATASDKSAIKTTVTSFGTVQGIVNNNGSPTLNIDGVVSEPLSKVIAVNGTAS